MNEPLPEVATPPEIEAQEYRVPASHAMPPEAVQANLLQLAQLALGARNGAKGLLEHPHAKESLAELGPAILTLSEKLWRTLLAALAKVE
jgi:hypothetical protein